MQKVVYNYKSLVGEKFGRLEVIAKVENKNGHSAWLCKCKCGNEKIVRGDSLKQNVSQSCGCLSKEKTRQRITEKHPAISHGMSKSDTYKIYRGMIARCYSEKSTGYPHYGAKGVTVCDRWLENFTNFLDDMGERPGKDYSLERVDGDDGYAPENVVWALDKIQSQNRAMFKNNSSGITGVGFVSNNGYCYWKATWVTLSGKKCSKQFSVLKLGFEEAKLCAIIFREKKIEELNIEGANYSEHHGR